MWQIWLTADLNMRENLRMLQIKITTRQKSKFLHSSLKLKFQFHPDMMKFVQVCGALADRLIKETGLFRWSCLLHLIITNYIQKLVALSLFKKINSAEIGFLGKHMSSYFLRSGLYWLNAAENSAWNHFSTSIRTKSMWKQLNLWLILLRHLLL